MEQNARDGFVVFICEWLYSDMGGTIPKVIHGSTTEFILIATSNI